MSDAAPLLNRLRTVGRVQGLVATAAAACVLVAGLIALLLLVVAADALLGLSQRGLIIADMLLLIGGALAALRFAQVLRAHRFDPRRLARQVEDRLRVHDSSLINAIDLSSDSADALRSAAIDAGNQTAATIAPRVLADTAGLKRGIAALAGVLVVLVAASMLAPRVFRAVLPRLSHPSGDHPPFTLVDFDVQTEPQRIFVGKSATITATLTGPTVPDRASVVFVDDRSGSPQRVPMLHAGGGRFVLPIDRADAPRVFYIDTPAGRSRRFALHVLPTPQVEHVAVRYRYPLYTQWPDRDTTLDTAGLKAIQGTQVTLTVRSNVRLAEGTLRLVPDAGPTRILTLLADPADPMTVAGSFILEHSGRFDLTLIGLDGAESEQPVSALMQAVPDAAPRIAFDEPDPLVVAPESWKVDLKVSVNDDVAVRSARLHFDVNDSSPGNRPLKLTHRGRNQASAEDRIDLAELRAAAGDVVHYYATANDNGPTDRDRNDRIGTTPVHAIHVISMKEYLDLVRTRYGVAQVEREVAAWIEELSALRQQREALLASPSEEALRTYAAAAARLATAMRRRAQQPQLYAFEQPYVDQLRAMAAQLDHEAAARSVADLRAHPGPLRLSHNQRMTQMSRDLHRLTLADAMLRGAEQVRRIAQQQHQLSEELARFQHAPPAESRERDMATHLADRQDALRRELDHAVDQLRQASRDASGHLPTMSYSARRLTERIDLMDIGRDQLAAALRTRAGRRVEAYAAADLAARKLDALLTDAQPAMGDAGEQDLDQSLSMSRESLRQSLSEMARSHQPPQLSTNAQAQVSAGTGLATGRISMVGPHVLSSSQPAVTGRGGMGDGTGTGDGPRQGRDTMTQVLNPQTRSHEAATAAGLVGVPVQYRQDAEAYFRRIAGETAP